MKVLWRMRKRMTTTTTIMVINKLLAHQNEFTERIHREVQMRHHSHGKWHQKPNENRKRVSSRLNFPDEGRMSTEVTSQNRCFLRKDGLPAVKPARCIDLSTSVHLQIKLWLFFSPIFDCFPDSQIFHLEFVQTVGNKASRHFVNASSHRGRPSSDRAKSSDCRKQSEVLLYWTCFTGENRGFRRVGHRFIYQQNYWLIKVRGIHQES